MSKVYVVKITIWGIVQGVGFRPFVAKLASRLGLQGEVRNTGGLVEILIKDTEERIQEFLAALRTEKPEPAEIVHIKTEEAPDREFDEFSIVDSLEGDRRAALIPADLAFCPDCMREMQDPENSRYLHPFISCMACGPRYTIIDRIPYDRENTSMVEYAMCSSCEKEYTSMADRRFHAQTVSCHDCGPQMRYRIAEGYDTEGAMLTMEADRGEARIRERVMEPLGKAERLLKEGAIVALKGVGGYNFLCDPFRGGSVSRLRRLKGREEKPFAVMFPDMESLSAYCVVSAEEKALLETPARPIVLLKKKGEPFCYDTCRSSRYVGAFLPSMGAQWLLTQVCGPLIVTSANRSGELIIREDGEMMAFLEQEEAAAKEAGSRSLLAGVFYNDRKIRVSVDDSVMRMIDGSPQMIRRSKGYAPVPVYVAAGETSHAERGCLSENTGAESAADHMIERSGTEMLRNSGDCVTVPAEIEEIAKSADYTGEGAEAEMLRRSKDCGVAKSTRPAGEKEEPEGGITVGGMEEGIFAAGSDLKNSLALCKGPFAYISQYFGDLDGGSIFRQYEETASRMEKFFRIRPTLTVCDRHPRYRSTAYAEEYAKRCGTELLYVQHHHAHIASVMAEHGLEGPVIGIAFDGTGYGTDGAIWGSEFLICRNACFQRAGHLEYVKMLGGDSSMKEGWKSELCYLYHAGMKSERPEASLVYAALKQGINSIQSSSMGRLFDAISAYLGIRENNRYEGECAILLENAAAEALEKGADPVPLRFELREEGQEILLSAKKLFEELQDTASVSAAALGFHYAVAEAIFEVCRRIYERYGIRDVAVAGGTFQNKILMEETLSRLRRGGFHVYYNHSVSPNDGGVCLGQAYLAMQYRKYGEEGERQDLLR